MMAIQLLDLAIKQEHSIRSEYDKRTSTSKAIEPKGEEQVTATHNHDGAIHLHLPLQGHYAQKLIHRKRSQKQEQASQ